MALSYSTGYYLNNLGYPIFQNGRHRKTNNAAKDKETPTYSAWASPHVTLPSFDTTLPKNVTSLKNSNAYLHCIVRDIGNKTVSFHIEVT